MEALLGLGPQVWGILGAIALFLLSLFRARQQGARNERVKMERRSMKTQKRVEERMSTAREHISQENEEDVKRSQQAAVERPRYDDASELPDDHAAILFRNRGGRTTSG